MWTCPECSNEVEDHFDNCPKCGTGSDGSEAPVDFVREDDALQPKLPVGESGPKQNTRLVEVIVAIIAIIILLVIAFAK